MNKRFRLWFGLGFVGCVAIIVAADMLAPSLLGGHRMIGRLFLPMAAIGFLGIVIDAVLQLRAGESIFKSFAPMVTILAVISWKFSEDISAIGSALMSGQLTSAMEDSSGIRYVARNGQYRPRMMLGTQPVDFLIDQNVTDIVLKREDAERVGIEVSSLTFDQQIKIGNDTVAVATVRLPPLQIGAVTLADLPAKVAAGPMPDNLLGSGFLARLGSWRVENGVLILKP